MESKVTGIGNQKIGTKLSKSEKSILAGYINAREETNRQKMIAIAAYYRAEKRGFKGNEAGTLKDWHEAEMEIDNELSIF